VTESHESPRLDNPLRTDAVAMRARGARHENPTPGGVLASTAPDGMALGDHELRTFCRRLLGWSSARAEPVDAAIDHLLAAVARRTPIALRGTSDLVPCCVRAAPQNLRIGAAVRRVRSPAP